MQTRLLTFLPPIHLEPMKLNWGGGDCQEYPPTSKAPSGREALHSPPAVELGEVTLELAGGISDLFRVVYGSRYHRRVLHDPGFIHSQIISGRWIPFGVVSPSGALLAHAALLQTPGGDWKFARSVVHPSARGMGCSSKILDAAIAFARDYLKCKRLLSEAVTSHSITQTLFASRGFIPSAIFPGKFIDYFHSGYRESTVLYTRHLSPPSPMRRPIFVCDPLEDLALRIRERVSAPQGLKLEALPNLQSGTINCTQIEGMNSILLEISGPANAREVRKLVKSYQNLGWGDAEAPSTQPASYLEVAVNISDSSGIYLTEVCLELGLRPLGVSIADNYDLLLLGWGEQVNLVGLPEIRLEDPSARELASELEDVWSSLQHRHHLSNEFVVKTSSVSFSPRLQA